MSPGSNSETFSRGMYTSRKGLDSTSNRADVRLRSRRRTCVDIRIVPTTKRDSIRTVVAKLRKSDFFLFSKFELLRFELRRRAPSNCLLGALIRLFFRRLNDRKYYWGSL